jgi:hypothetical protein
VLALAAVVLAAPAARAAEAAAQLAEPSARAADSAAGALGAAAGETPPVAVRTVRLDGGLRVRPAAGGRTAAIGCPETVDTGIRFTMLGIVCAVPSTPGDVTVQLRTSLDGRAWGAWLTASLEVVQEGDKAPRAFTEAVWTGAGRFVQVRAAGAAGAPAALERVRIVALDPRIDAPSLPTAAAAVTAPSLAASPAAARGAARITGARPAIVTRKQWGADESWRGSKPEYAKVKMVFVHHTDSRNEYTRDEAPAIMRAIYAYHTQSLGWSDIGYNFLVDRFGTIYEGHYGGMTRGVVGAQVLGFNRGSVGISVIGDFAGDAIPAEALASLEKLVAWKLKVHHLKPGGTARIRCTYGQRFRTGQLVRFPVVAGHRDANFTECPGNIFYPLLPTVRLEAAGRPQPPIVTLAQGVPSHFSPNDDGTQDVAGLGLWLTKAAAWSIEVRDEKGERIGSFSGEGTSAEVTWPGLDEQGRARPDGTYSAVVTAANDLGNAAAKTVRLVLDTVAPQLRSAEAEYDWFSPNDDGWAETAKVTYRAAEKAATRVSIVDGAGKVERRLTDWRDASDAEQSATWNGDVTSGDALAPAPDGEYAFLVECRDAAGNVSRKKAAILVDRTLGFLAASPETVSPNGDGVNDATTLGFTLARPATVKVTVKVAGKGVRSYALGQLPAGPGAAVWDGLTAEGAPVASGPLTFSVSATSSLGSSSASRKFAADLERPVLTAGAAALTVKLGKSAKLTCTAQDGFSDAVELGYVVTDMAGLVAASGTKGWVAAGSAATVTWRPALPGLYTVTWTGADRGGNRELAPAVTLVTAQ